MQAAAKGDMGFRAAGRIEGGGVVPGAGVAVGGGQQRGDLIAALEGVAHDLDILISPAGEHVQGGVKAQHFLNRGVGGGFGVGQGAGSAGFQQSFDAIADGVNGCLMPGVQKEDAGGDQLVSGQTVALGFGGDQMGDQVITRVLAAGLDIAAQEGDKSLGRGDGAVFAGAVVCGIGAPRHIHANHGVGPF